MGLLEDAQLMGYRGLGCAEGLGDLVDAELVGHQRVQDLDARGIAEHLEQVGQVVEHLLLGHGVLSGSRCLLIYWMLIHVTSSHMNTCSYIICL